MKRIRARGEDLRRIEIVRGEPYVLPSEKGLAQKIVSELPYVRGVAWRTLGPGQLVARIELRWWAFLTLGWLHARALRLGRAIIDKYKPASVTVLVAVWG